MVVAGKEIYMYTLLYSGGGIDFTIYTGLIKTSYVCTTKLSFVYTFNGSVYSPQFLSSFKSFAPKFLACDKLFSCILIYK